MNPIRRKEVLEEARPYLSADALAHPKHAGYLVHPTRVGYVPNQLEWYNLDKNGIKVYASPENNPPTGRGIYGDMYFYTREEVLNTAQSLEMIW